MAENLASNIQEKTIKKVFDQRSDFIIIGLTGSSDGHLSDVTDIMQKNFDDIRLTESGLNTETEKREYRNIYRYAKLHWRPFDVIKARDIIITYILENYNTVNRFTTEISKNIFEDKDFNCKCAGYFKLIKKQLQIGTEEEKQLAEMLQDFLDEYNEEGLLKKLLDKNHDLMEYIYLLRNKNGSSFNYRTDLSLYLYTKYILPVIGKCIKEVMNQDHKYTWLFRRYGNEIRFFGTLDMSQWYSKISNMDETQKFDSFYSIAKRLNTFIKIRRSPLSNKKSVPIQIVVDCLKNPYESNFLKDRYSAYYSMALLNDEDDIENPYNMLYENPGKVKKQFKQFVNLTYEKIQQTNSFINSHICQYVEALKTPESYLEYFMDKLKNMDSQQYTMKICPNLDSLTYDEQYVRFGISETEFDFFKEILDEPVRIFCMLSDLYSFYLQDVQNTTQNADIFVGRSNNGAYKNLLKYRIVKYISLIMHPGLVPPTPVENCMQAAFSAKVNSGCISRQVGAVVTDKDYNILSLGWNDVYCDRVSCIYRSFAELQKSSGNSVYSDLENDENSAFRRFVNAGDFQNCDKVLDGLPTAYCFKSIYNSVMHEANPVNSRAIHGEQRAFYSCDKEKARGGCLFTTSSSCVTCTLFAALHGIKKIYYIEKYPDIAQQHVAGIGQQEDRPEFILFEGVVGLAYMKLYTPIIPLKDELQLRGIERFYGAYR